MAVQLDVRWTSCGWRASEIATVDRTRCEIERPRRGRVGQLSELRHKVLRKPTGSIPEWRATSSPRTTQSRSPVVCVGEGVDARRPQLPTSSPDATSTVVRARPRRPALWRWRCTCSRTARRGNGRQCSRRMHWRCRYGRGHAQLRRRAPAGRAWSSRCSRAEGRTIRCLTAALDGSVACSARLVCCTSAQARRCFMCSMHRLRSGALRAVSLACLQSRG